jgi:hypothetical protein
VFRSRCFVECCADVAVDGAIVSEAMAVAAVSEIEEILEGA